MTLDELSSIARANGLALSPEQMSLLERYVTLLKEKNQVVNLISRKDEEHILERHILHSLTMAMPDVIGYTIPPQVSVFDIGTGGGLPGIPLAIVRPDLQVVLCDSITKKITAVQEFIAALPLHNAQALTARAEDLAKSGMRQTFTCVVSRAVAPLDELLKWTKALLKPGGILFSLKGGDLQEEIARTQQMPSVQEVSERMLNMNHYDGFAREEKKVIRVLLK